MGWQHFRLTDHVIEHKLLLIVNSLHTNSKSSDFTLIENNSLILEGETKTPKVIQEHQLIKSQGSWCLWGGGLALSKDG